jgi:hypothetical protein
LVHRPDLTYRIIGARIRAGTPDCGCSRVGHIPGGDRSMFAPMRAVVAHRIARRSTPGLEPMNTLSLMRAEGRLFLPSHPADPRGGSAASNRSVCGDELCCPVPHHEADQSRCTYLEGRDFEPDPTGHFCDERCRTSARPPGRSR